MTADDVARARPTCPSTYMQRGGAVSHHLRRAVIGGTEAEQI
jgi:hypothetical protein